MIDGTVRARMVDEQIERRGIHSLAVLRAMRAVPREAFVPGELAAAAYEDRPLDIGHGQTISQPYMVATMTDALAARPGAKILEVGTGSGYQTAVLCEIGCIVVSVERIAALAETARATLRSLGYRPEIRVGDGTLGLPDAAPFDGILVAAGGPEVPIPLVAQLAERGRLVIPVGDRESQELLLVERADGRVTRRVVCACRFVKLIGEHGWANSEDPNDAGTS